MFSALKAAQGYFAPTRSGIFPGVVAKERAELLMTEGSSKWLVEADGSAQVCSMFLCWL